MRSRRARGAKSHMYNWPREMRWKRRRPQDDDDIPTGSSLLGWASAQLTPHSPSLHRKKNGGYKLAFHFHMIYSDRFLSLSLSAAIKDFALNWIIFSFFSPLKISFRRGEEEEEKKTVVNSLSFGRRRRTIEDKGSDHGIKLAHLVHRQWS